MEDTDHGRPAPVRTRASARSVAGGDVAVTSGGDVSTADVDLTGIDPVHWAETRERVAILRAWCANGRHPRAEALAAAERMGVTVTHFYRLVAAWKKHRDALRISGHPSRRGDERGPKSIPADARAAMLRVVAEQGPDARFTDVLALVRSACAAAGVRTPSSGMVHREMMRARQRQTATVGGAPDDVAVAVVSCLLPVMVGGEVIDAPNLVLAVERPGGTIVGHRLVLDGDLTSAARTVIAGLAKALEAPISVSSPLADAIVPGAAAVGQPHRGSRMDGAGVTLATRATLLSTTLGNYIDSIPIWHRRSTSRSAGPWKPLTAEDAVAAVDLAVAAHNAARGG